MALRDRNEWKFFAVLPQADRAARRRVVGWSSCCAARCPPSFADRHGRAGRRRAARPAAWRRRSRSSASSSSCCRCSAPIHQAVGANLGDRTAAWLYDRLTEACVRPPGMGHLEDPKLTSDLTVARDFDLGHDRPAAVASRWTSSPAAWSRWSAASRRRSCSPRYAWWAPLVLGGAWLATHWLLRESAVWRDRNTEEVRGAQRDADYAYRLAVDPPAAKELRLFGLAGWTIDRFVNRRTRLHELQYAATRLRERPVVVEPAARASAPTSSCSGRSRSAASGGSLDLGGARHLRAERGRARR